MLQLLLLIRRGLYIQISVEHIKYDAHISGLPLLLLKMYIHCIISILSKFTNKVRFILHVFLLNVFFSYKKCI